MGSIIIGGIIVLLIVWFIMKPREKSLLQRFPDEGTELSTWVSSGKRKDMSRAAANLVWYSSQLNKDISKAESYCAAESTIGQMIMSGMSSSAPNGMYYMILMTEMAAAQSVCRYNQQGEDSEYQITFRNLIHFYKATQSELFLRTFLGHAQHFPQQLDGMTVGEILMSFQNNLHRLIREGRIK